MPACTQRPGSNARWIGLTPAGDPVSLRGLKDRPGLAAGPWHSAVKDPPNSIFREDFTYVIGLYSRHGRFYPPFNAIPDVSWPQLIANFEE